jgi:N-acetylmuramoyl-L-alanine amidase
VNSARNRYARLATLPALALTALVLAGGFDPGPPSGTGDPGQAASVASPAEPRAAAPRPAISQKRIPFGKKRRRETANYSKRHYGDREWRLENPKVIVQHYSVTPTIGAIYNTFRTDRPDPEFDELPNVCAHFAVARNGRIFQFVSLDIRCRHTVGLNHTAIGIEHVGNSDGEVLSNRRQMRGSLKLTRWLRCRFGIATRNVIGHNESLNSPYHREKVKKMKRVTHGDFRPSSMRRYRKQLRKAGKCPRVTRPGLLSGQSRASRS